MATLTKSLHTITAVTNVARHLLEITPNYRNTGATTLAHNALRVLGYAMECFPNDDVTLVRCVAGCEKLIAEARAQLTRDQKAFVAGLVARGGAPAE